MRPVIIETLNNHLHTAIFNWLIPQSFLLHAFAFIICLIIFIKRSSVVGLSRSYAFWSGIWAIAFGLIGAKTYYVLQHPDIISKSPSLIWAGGTGSLGGYIGGAIGFIVSLRLYRTQILKYLDVAASTLGLGVFFGRLGCFLDGCCFGATSSLPWAVRFPPESLPYNAQLGEGLIESGAVTSLPIHPTQIYLALNGLLLFFLASWYWHRLLHIPGATFFIYWLSWCITRFAWEFLRGDTVRGFVGPLSVPQFLCLLLLAPLTLGLWWSLKFRYNHFEKGGLNGNYL